MAFPVSPTEGQTFTENNTVWIYSAVTDQWNRSVINPLNQTTYIGSDGAPGGIGGATQVIFNDNGSLASDAGLVYNKTTDALSAGGFIPTSSTVPANGVYLPAANSVAVATNGAGRLAINSSGQVFVNQLTQLSNHSSPALELTGDAVINSASFGTGNESSLYFYHRRLDDTATRQGSSVHSIAEDSYTSGSGGTFDSTLAFRTVLNNVANERLRITSDGKVGIGTSSPSQKLTITDTHTLGLSGNAIHFYRDSGNYFILEGGSNAFFQFRYGSTDLVKIDSSGRVGIGVTSPVNALHINGAAGGVSSRFRLSSTEGSGFTIRSESSTETMLNVDSSENLLFGVGGGEVARIDSSGRLLVGTSSTSAANTVVLQGSSAGSTIQSILTLARGSTSPTDTNLLGSIRFSDSGHASAAAVDARRDGGTWTSGSSQPTYLEFSTTADGAASPTERLRITSAGLVGIGCASPDSLMHLESSSSFLSISNSTDTGEAGILFRRTDNNQNRGLVVYDYTADALKFRASDNGAGEDMRIDSSGRLLIGTSSSVNVGSTASAKLQVGHPTGNVSAAFYCTANSVQGGSLVLGHGRGSTTGVLQSDDTVGDIRFAGADGIDLQSQAATIRCEVDGTPGANDMPGRLVFSTTADGASSPTERLRITSNGFQACTSAGNGIEMGVTASAGTSTQIFRGRHSATAGSYATGTVAFNVFSNGNVQNTNNSYGAISDIKLKENIVDANSQWDDLKALQVRNYNFKEETGQETHTQIGLVAQEVELVSPGLVSESPDRDAEGNDLGTVTKSVNYSVLYMKAVKALQEAMERIETLEQRLNDAGIN
jgi:hypothetical protein